MPSARRGPGARFQRPRASAVTTSPSVTHASIRCPNAPVNAAAPQLRSQLCSTTCAARLEARTDIGGLGRGGAGDARDQAREGRRIVARRRRRSISPPCVEPTSTRVGPRFVIPPPRRGSARLGAGGAAGAETARSIRRHSDIVPAPPNRAASGPGTSLSGSRSPTAVGRSRSADRTRRRPGASSGGCPLHVLISAQTPSLAPIPFPMHECLSGRKPLIA